MGGRRLNSGARRDAAMAASLGAAEVGNRSVMAGHLARLVSPCLGSPCLLLDSECISRETSRDIPLRSWRRRRRPFFSRGARGKLLGRGACREKGGLEKVKDSKCRVSCRCLLLR